MDAASLQKVKGQMHSFAMGEAMAQAARDYQKEMMTGAGGGSGARGPAFNAADALEDPELARLHEERLEELKAMAERRAAKKAQTSYGTLIEIAEQEFLATVTKAEHVVCHFFHAGFARCATMDRHLALLAAQYPLTQFVRLSAPDAPFFTAKLQIRTLPCVVIFENGVAIDRIVGFEGIAGAGTDFKTAALETRLLPLGVLQRARENSDDEAERRELAARTLRQGGPRRFQRTESDEDSDFSD